MNQGDLIIPRPQRRPPASPTSATARSTPQKRLLPRLVSLTLLLATPVYPQAREGRRLAEMTIEELMNIDVKAATKTDTPELQVPQAIYTLNRTDIERLPANSLGELLRSVVGANVVRAQTSQNIVAARGSNPFTPSKILILIDGQPIDPALFSTTWWELVPVSIGDIERIEFIRSPGTIYGANAQNGVVNIITQKPAPGANGQNLKFSGKFGQQNLQQAYLGLLGRSGKVSYRVSTDLWKVNAYRNDTRLEIVPGRPSALGEQTFAAYTNQLNLQNVSAGLETSLGENPIRASFGFKKITNAQGRVPDRLCFVGLDGYVGYANASYSFDKGGLKHTVSADNDRINYRFLRNSDSPAEPLNPSEMSIRKLTFGYEAKKFLPRRHSLLAGATLALETAQNASGEKFIVDQAIRQDPILTAYVQDAWEITEKDHLYYGGLLASHYVAGSSFSPMVGYVRQLTARNILRLATSTSYRNPNVFEHSMDYDQATGAATKRSRLVSNRGLRAERTTSYEAGLRAVPAENLFLSVDFYLNHVRGAIEWTLVGVDRSPEPRPRYRSENSLRQSVGGVEGVAKYRFRKYWSLENHFSFTTISNRSFRPEYRGTSGAGVNGVGQGRYGAEYTPPVLYQPIVSFERNRFQTSAQYQYAAAHTWQWPSWSASTGRESFLLKPVPGYGILNWYAGVDLGQGFRLALEAYNLLDNRHTEWRGDESYFGRALRVRLQLTMDSTSAKP